MEIPDILKSIPLFGAVLDKPKLEVLAANLTLKQFHRGAVLMRQGDIGSSMFVLVEGNVGVSIHTPAGDQDVAKLGPGEIVGEMSLMTGARRSATVTALRPVTAIEVTKAALESLLVSTPGLIHRFAGMMEQRRAELDSVHKGAQRWNQIGLTPPELIARMTAFYSG